MTVYGQKVTGQKVTILLGQNVTGQKSQIIILKHIGQKVTNFNFKYRTTSQFACMFMTFLFSH